MFSNDLVVCARVDNYSSRSANKNVHFFTTVHYRLNNIITPRVFAHEATENVSTLYMCINIKSSSFAHSFVLNIPLA